MSITQTISHFPEPLPDRDNDTPEEFSDHVDNFLGHIPTFVDEVNTWADQANDLAQVMNEEIYNRFRATSNTTLTIGTGTKTLSLNEDHRAFFVGSYVRVVENGDPATNYMEGVVTAYDDATDSLTVHVSVAGGSGTYSEWSIALAGSLDTTQIDQNTAQLKAARDNIVLNAFRIAINGALSRFGMVDGVVDEFEDETGIDTTNTTSVYDSDGDKFIFGRDMNLSFTTSSLQYAGYREQLCQAFTAHEAGLIDKVEFRCYKYGSPTGNVYAKIYAATGTVGVDAVPTGSPLATSDPIDITTISSTMVNWYTFTFSTPCAVSPGDYCVVIEYTGGDSSNWLRTYYYDTDSHYGNMAYTDTAGSGWTAWGSYDLAFVVYGINNYAISNPVTAEAQPDSCRLVLFEEDVDAIVLGTDLKAYVSRDGGTTFTEVTLTDEGDYETSKRILAGTADISAQPAGTSMVWKVENDNGKQFYLHGIGMLWD